MGQFTYMLPAMMKRFCKNSQRFSAFILAKSSILDNSQGRKYASEKDISSGMTFSV